MNATVVWIDREHAKIFQISDVKMERKHVEALSKEHHTHALDNIDHQRKENRLFSEVIFYLNEAQHLLILGPGMARHHFLNYLMEHHPALAKKISGSETVDHPSDAQIAALAKQYFKIGELAKSK